MTEKLNPPSPVAALQAVVLCAMRYALAVVDPTIADKELLSVTLILQQAALTRPLPPAFRYFTNMELMKIVALDAKDMQDWWKLEGRVFFQDEFIPLMEELIQLQSAPAEGDTPKE